MKEYRLENGLGLERPSKMSISPSRGLLRKEGDYGKVKYHPQEYLELQILKDPAYTRVRLEAPLNTNRQPSMRGALCDFSNSFLPVSHPGGATARREKRRRRKSKNVLSYPCLLKVPEPEIDLI